MDLAIWWFRQFFVAKTSFAAQVPPLMWLDAPARVSAEMDVQTVAQLTALEDPSPLQNKRFLLTAKIKEIEPAQAWWYLACTKCYRGTKDCGGTLRCSDHSCAGTEGTARYRLSLRVIDPEEALEDGDAPTVILVFFGPTAEELIGAPVHELLGSQDAAQSAVPERIENLYGKTLTAKVGVNRYSFTTLDISLQVKSIVSILHQETAEASAPGHQSVQTSSSQELTHTVSDKGKSVASDEPSTKSPPRQEVAEKETIQVLAHEVEVPDATSDVSTPVAALSESAHQSHSPTEKSKQDMTPPPAAPTRQRSTKEETTPPAHKRATTAARRKLAFDDAEAKP